MKTRIIALLAAAALTTGVVAVPHVAAQTTAKPQSITLDQALNFCTKAYSEYRRTKNLTFFDQGMQSLDVKLRPVVALVCAGYGQGFEDGWKGRPTA